VNSDFVVTFPLGRGWINSGNSKGGCVAVAQPDVEDKDVELILTRSIRRKLVIGLVVVFAMVLLLSITGLSALYAYWRVVDNLRTSQEKEPRRDDLSRAISGLTESITCHTRKRVENEEKPPVAETPKESTIYEYAIDEELWNDRWTKFKNEWKDFIAKTTDDLDSKAIPGSGIYSLTQSRLQRISKQLDLLEEKCKRIANEPNHSQLAQEMHYDVASLQFIVHSIPHSSSAVDLTLSRSRDVVKVLSWAIGIPTVIVVFLFFGLIYFGNRWILIPIRQLHEAASRVANGDYTYRLKLRGKDEMVELGEMFNKMTERFQTDKEKLAQEVEVRSRQILRNERLAGIGFFASGVAHEINNPLQAIGAAAESLTGRLSEGSLGRGLPKEDRELLSTYLGMIERESTRCQQITSRVLDFARGTNGPKTRQDLTKIVVEVLEMVSHMSKYDGRKIIFDRTVPHLVDVSAAEMKQVVLNLVANGLEAMNGTGTMTIRIDEMVDEVVLSVKDDGCGMTASVIENLYEPFFTEKLNGKGTGLGLSITHRIVGDHGGRIEATSGGPGTGSTFLVHLPRCCKAAKTAAA
jgi:signal transduction histidine kinase